MRAIRRGEASASSDEPTEKVRLLALREYGNFALAYSATFQPGLDYFGGKEGFLAYKQVGSTAFVLSNPLAPVGGCEDLIRKFVSERRDVCFWQASRPVAKILEKIGFCVNEMEEKRFRRRFGQSFLVYENRVPCWLPWPRPLIHRNDLSIYGVSADWWDDKTRWLRTLQNLVPARFAFFDPIVGDWRGKAVLDLGCGGGFMAALCRKGAPK